MNQVSKGKMPFSSLHSPRRKEQEADYITSKGPLLEKHNQERIIDLSEYQERQKISNFSARFDYFH